jgi:hypothetical protein
MKLKLSRKSKEGKQGWKEASAEHLSRLLCEHIRKGDPVDVANFAMMLHQNGQSITLDCTPLVDVDALIHTLTRAENLIQRQMVRIAELEAQNVELGRVGW